MADGRIAVIVEGEKRELDYWTRMAEVFFPAVEFDVIVLSAGENIYMLWKQLERDDYETDIIELVREYSPHAAQQLDGLSRDDFQEIYLFFDFDPHQSNIAASEKMTTAQVLEKMLKVFDNETENGKLYISYPMCEALRDIRKGSCRAFWKCVVPIADMSAYKQFTGDRNPYGAHKRYSKETWAMVMAIFLHRCRCLMNQEPIAYDSLYAWYRSQVNTEAIFHAECALDEKLHMVFVLSAFPEFLLDYFRPEYWADWKNSFTDIERKGCVQSPIVCSCLPFSTM